MCGEGRGQTRLRETKAEGWHAGRVLLIVVNGLNDSKVKLHWITHDS